MTKHKSLLERVEDLERTTEGLVKFLPGHTREWVFTPADVLCEKGPLDQSAVGFIRGVHYAVGMITSEGGPEETADDAIKRAIKFATPSRSRCEDAAMNGYERGILHAVSSITQASVTGEDMDGALKRAHAYAERARGESASLVALRKELDIAVNKLIEAFEQGKEAGEKVAESRTSAKMCDSYIAAEKRGYDRGYAEGAVAERRASVKKGLEENATALESARREGEKAGYRDGFKDGRS